MTSLDIQEEHRQKKRKWSKEWAARNPERVKENRRRWREENPTYHKDYFQKKYKENPEKFQRAGQKWKEENHDAFLKMTRNGRYKRKYGITAEDRDLMLTQQGDKCACCGNLDPGSKCGWHTDHSHKTNKIRGIICQSCNLTLGHVKDNAETLQKMIAYLQKHGE